LRTAYVDTSCLAAIAFDERNSRAMQRRLASFDELVAAPLLEAELRAALRREGSHGSVALDELLEPIAWIAAERALSAEIATVLAAGYVRGADCWHLATALYFSPEPTAISFLTLDERQREVARALGFKT
jgi:predicted nucleic acid-binding protein